MPEVVDLLRNRLRETPDHAPIPNTAFAAVLVPLIRGDSVSVLFTRRSDDLSSHSGEISFPGGRVDPGEHPREAALREADEELGVPPESVDVLGPLPTAFTVVSGFHISPWVGALTEPRFTPNPAEIAEVIEIPLEVLRNPETSRIQTFIRAGHLFRNPAYDVDSHTIWGATARILTELLEEIEAAEVIG
ncbi:MAG: NUDIX hydrolase [Actinomycetota bacterium]